MKILKADLFCPILGHITLFLLLLINSQASSAGIDVYDPGTKPEVSLEEYHSQGFIGGPNDTSDVAKDVWKDIVSAQSLTELTDRKEQKLLV